MKRITGSTKLLGVIGQPIEHSLSPILHNAALTEMELDYVYLPFAIAPGDLDAAIAGFRAIDLQGFSVTIPHKQAILSHLTGITDVAAAIGAVNTVWKTEAGWHGTNTDVIGFLAPLQALQTEWGSTCAIVLGNGGAARAVVAGCAQLGCAEIQVVGRNPDKLTQFLQSWHGSSLAPSLQTYPWDALPTLLSRADLVVNTTPIGMSPQVERSPLTPMEIQQLKNGAIAYDLIYVPNPTLFLQHARSQGCITIDGLEMLIGQGAAALEIWTGRAVPINTMRQAVRQHLGMTG
ncbi:shikimate dehydrogenase [Myxacorys almedinensis]|uniref:Shikimate dehydrogenase (NADP(+)) n=1 Tax=Myxacorys almedinensis A TaxID=2690445 RepID=A0A8J8CIU1_9CYAN|nr:shikimate dehydrogenase [Myxacorys almedinensis]NDJ18288.1 shikimate dehydrogenase [Myxacorys almedinensis A]